MSLLYRLLLIAGLAAFCLPIAGLFFQFPAMAMLVLAVAAWCNRRGWPGSGYAYGTARLASLVDLIRAGMIGGSGLLLGRASLSPPPPRRLAVRCLLSPAIRSAIACRVFLAAFWRRDRSLIRVNDYVHLLTCALAGAGKSRAVIVPNLLSYTGSCVIVDPKGELYKKTAAFRRRVFGHQIIRLDPFNVAEESARSDTLNPLDFLDAASDGFIDDVRTIADSMVIRQGTETDPHWNDWAVVMISAFLAFVRGCERDAGKRHLGLVRELVSSRHAYLEAGKAMRQVRGFGGVIAKFGNLISWLVDRELGSVMSSVQRHTAWMDSPAVAANLERSSWKPDCLRSGKATVYLILPQDKLSTLAPLMRLWLSTILRVVTANGASESHQILFIIDEAAHLGRMPVLQNAITVLRGFGIRIWLFFQDIDQLKTCYGEHAPAILGNMATQQYFGTLSYETAQYLSKRIGDFSLVIDTINGGTSRSRPTGQAGGGGSYTENEGYSYSEIGRPVLRPDEILTLPADVGLVFHKNHPPIAAEQVLYDQAPEFKGRRAGRERGRGLAMAASILLMLLAGGLLGGIVFDWRPSKPPAGNAWRQQTSFTRPAGNAWRRQTGVTRPAYRAAAPPADPGDWHLDVWEIAHPDAPFPTGRR